MARKANKSRKAKKVVAVSGGFDPVHVGHVRLFQEAKALGDELVVILNNDNWFGIKGRHMFMSARERKEVIEEFKSVDSVILSKHKRSKKVFNRNTKEYSICRELEELRPDIFANGGDRFADDIPEFKLCKKLGIEMVFNVGRGGKVRSSSELLKAYVEKHKLTKNKKKV